MAYFADTSYYVALLVDADETHQRVTELMPQIEARLITTAFVLLELSAYFAKPPQRGAWCTCVQQLRLDPDLTILPAEQALVDRGWEMYAAHRDKSWSLTDCISFIVMRERGVSDALTTDHHFEQAGFHALLKKDQH